MRAHLAELANLGLAAAENLRARMLATGDPKVTAQLAQAFAQVSDEVCRTIALEARLAREAGASDAAPRRRGLRPAAEPDERKPVKH